jgi:hypothetical protein
MNSASWNEVSTHPGCDQQQIERRNLRQFELMSPGCPKSKLPETNFDFYRDSTWENPPLGKPNPRKSSALRSSQPSGGSGDHGRGLALSNLRVLVCGGRDYANADALLWRWMAFILSVNSV